MDALMLALVLALLLDQGSGTQRLVARLGGHYDSGVPFGIVGGLMLIVAGNAAVGAILGSLISAWLIPDARLLFLSLALASGGIGLLWTALRPASGQNGKDLTGLRTLIPFALRRAGENAAFATAGVAAFTGAPLLTAGGAVLGGWAALILPLSFGEQGVGHGGMRAARVVAGLALLIATIGCAATALHLI